MRKNLAGFTKKEISFSFNGGAQRGAPASRVPRKALISRILPQRNPQRITKGATAVHSRHFLKIESSDQGFFQKQKNLRVSDAQIFFGKINVIRTPNRH